MVTLLVGIFYSIPFLIVIGIGFVFGVTATEIKYRDIPLEHCMFPRVVRFIRKHVPHDQVKEALKRL